MSLPYIADQEFVNENFSQNGFPLGEYDNCSFNGCDFSELNISGISFTGCEFLNCGFSNLNIRGTSFKEATFKSCKMLGLRIDECETFLLSFKFEDCILNFSSFFQLKLKGTLFSNCKLEQVDFSEADFSEATFNNCDFNAAVFSNTKLVKADLQTSFNFSIDPERNQLSKSIFSTENITGLLDKYGIIVR